MCACVCMHLCAQPCGVSMHIGLSREDDNPPEVGEGEVDTGADKEQVRLCNSTAKSSGWPCQPNQLATHLVVQVCVTTKCMG